MPLTLDLPPELEQRLRLEADRLKLPIADCALRLLEQHLPPLRLPPEERAAALAALFEEMDRQAESADADAEFETFAQNMNAKRTGGRLLYPPELKGITW